MIKRFTVLTLSVVLMAQSLPGVALADNQMGYRLLSADEAAGLPQHGGALGMDVGRAQMISEQDLSFELLRVNGVRSGSPGAQAGLRPGDQIIISAKITKVRGEKLAAAECNCTVGGQVVSSAELMFAMIDAEE